jgi:hypothetical protein
VSGDLDWRVAGGVDLGGVGGDPLEREPDDDELDARRAVGPWWKRERDAAAALEVSRRRRPEPMLTAGQALCPERPHEKLSECLRLEGHEGAHVVAGLVRGGARFYTADGGLILEQRLWFAGPTRAELAELWAWQEETTTQGRVAVGRRTGNV